MMRKSAILALLLSCFALAEGHRTAVGDGQVKAGALQPFQATWKVVAKGQQAGQIQSLITETLSVRKTGEGELYHRLQVTSGPDGVNSALAEVTFSRESLEPFTSRTKRGEQTAWDLSFAIEEGVTHAQGEARTQSGGPLQAIDRRAQMAGFDGAILGLVLAALPLEEGYKTQLPVLWIASASEYTVTARVTGRRRFADGRGGQIEAWAVAVDWLDLNSGQTFDGGDEGSGGTYYVVPDPPQGFPHVPAYINSSASIELLVELLQKASG